MGWPAAMQHPESSVELWETAPYLQTTGDFGETPAQGITFF